MKRFRSLILAGLFVGLAGVTLEPVKAQSSHCNCDSGYYICTIHDADGNVTGVMWMKKEQC